MRKSNKQDESPPIEGAVEITGLEFMNPHANCPVEPEGFEWNIANLQDGPRITPSFIDQFLLAIVDAYTDDKNSQKSKSDATRETRLRRTRLRDAKMALFGSVGRSLENIDDEAALYRMAWERSMYISKQWRESPLPPMEKIHMNFQELSDLELAKRVARFALGKTSITTVERLRKKYAKNRKHYQYLVDSHDCVAEQMERGALEGLKEVLEDAGIRMKLAPLPGEQFKIIETKHGA